MPDFLYSISMILFKNFKDFLMSLSLLYFFYNMALFLKKLENVQVNQNKEENEIKLIHTETFESLLTESLSSLETGHFIEDSYVRKNEYDSLKS